MHTRQQSDSADNVDRVMTPGQLDRKVRQLDNDVQAIYGMMADISATQRRQGVWLEEIATVQSEQGATLDRHSEILDGHTATLDGHTTMLEGHTAKLDKHSATLDSHTAKLDRILELLQAR